MSRALTIYTHKRDAGRGALASEITPADVERGRGGVVGDYYVVEPGYRPQWTERAAFHAEWEKLASPADAADLGPVIDDARAQIDALTPAPAPAPTSSNDTAASDSWDKQLVEIYAALRDAESRDRDLLERFNAMRDPATEWDAIAAAGELAARMERLEAQLAKFEALLGVDPKELEQLEPGPLPVDGAAAAPDRAPTTVGDDTAAVVSIHKSRGKK